MNHFDSLFLFSQKKFPTPLSYWNKNKYCCSEKFVTGGFKKTQTNVSWVSRPRIFLSFGPEADLKKAKQKQSRGCKKSPTKRKQLKKKITLSVLKKLERKSLVAKKTKWWDSDRKRSQFFLYHWKQMKSKPIKWDHSVQCTHLACSFTVKLFLRLKQLLTL